MPEPIDTQLYNRVKKLADKRFESKTGVYKSSWIVKEYKRLGGKYRGERKEDSGLKRWYKEKWVDLNRPIRDKAGKIIGYEECGRKSILKKSGKKQKYPLCRPQKRVTFATPKTVSELTESSIKKAKKDKAKVRESANIKFGGQPKSRKPRQSKLPQQKAVKSVDTILKEIKQGKVEKPKLENHLEELFEKYISIPEKQDKKQNKEQDIEKMNIAIERMLPSKYEWVKKTGGGKAQFYGKKSDIMVDVPKNVKRWAKYAFKLKELGFGGALKTGWKRAEQLSTKKSIPIEDLRYMRNWYARHIYASYPTFKQWIEAGKPNTNEWHRKHGIVSWVTWGANAGFNWVNSDKVINLLNKHFEKNYKKIK